METAEKTQKIEAVFHVNDPSPMAWQHVYTDGDRLEKIQGCEACKKHCCGTCALIVEGGKCRLHLDGPDGSCGQAKPWACCVKPPPDGQMSYCALVWKITAGPDRGRYRRKADPAGLIVDEVTLEKDAQR
jgi:hypothetical protein